MLQFQKPKYEKWGFNHPSPNLIKVVIDLRPPHMQWQKFAGSPLTDVTNPSGLLSFPTSSRHKPGEKVLDFPPLMVS